MDIVKAFSFVVEDKDWLTKLAIGTVIFLLGSIFVFPMLLLVGYQVAVTRQVMNGEKEPLPVWDDFGRYFMDGLNLVIAGLIYASPMLILLCGGMAVAFLPLLGAENEDLAAALGGVTAVTWIVISCLILLLSLVWLLLSPALYIQYAQQGTLAACLRFSEVMRIASDNIGDILIVAVVRIGASMVIGTVVAPLVATGCLAIVALPIQALAATYLSYTTGHMHGQIAAGKAAEYQF